MTKKHTQLPPPLSDDRDEGPSRNTRNRTKGEAAYVAPEDSIRVETKRQPTQMDGGNINQGDELEKRIAAAIEKAMPAILANLKRADEQCNRSEKKQCTCKTFMSYKPAYFSGEEDTIETVNWLEEMNAMLDINDCAEEDKVRFAARSFKSEALFWWHTILQTRGRDVVHKMSWDEFRNLLMDKFCSHNELHMMEGEFLKLKMTGLEHRKYTARFNELVRVAQDFVIPESRRIRRYINGLARLTDDLVWERKEIVSTKRKWEDTGRPMCMKCNKCPIARDCTGLPVCYECGAYSA